MKNGSVIRGTVVDYSGGQFTVMLDTSAGRAQSRAMLIGAEIDRIEFDASGSGPSGGSASGPPADTGSYDPQGSGPYDAQPSSPSDNGDYQPSGSSSQRGGSLPPPVADDGSSDPTPSQVPSMSAAGGREVDVIVRAKSDWTSSQVRLRRGDRVHITASGTVKLDPAGQRTASPAGINFPDRDKLITNRPTGALIAVVGDDNDDFVFVGSQADFVAQRDGMLFLSVNEGFLGDNTGTFQAHVVVEGASTAGTASRRTTQAPSAAAPKPAAPRPTAPTARREQQPAAAKPAPANTRPSTPASTAPTASQRPSTPPAAVDSATRELDIQVSAKNDWTSTQIRVQPGTKIRVSASGTVQLDKTGQHTAGPGGVEVADKGKLIANRPTGALIAVIGDDNDDFIFVGQQSEFTAQRDGLLFLSINEGDLGDNNGVFAVHITIEQPRKVASR